MKTIFKDGFYERVTDNLGEFKVKNQGWKFVSKEEWKKKVRDFYKMERKTNSSP